MCTRWSLVGGALGVGPEIPVFPAKIGKTGFALALMLIEDVVPRCLQEVMDGVWFGRELLGVGASDS